MRVLRCVLVLALAACAARADIIVRPRSSGRTLDLVTALRSKASAAREVELSGSSSADAALVPHEAHAGDIVYAIGPDAVVAARSIDKKSKIVALNVPNPDRLGTAATYVSAYPNLNRTFGVLAEKLFVKKVGVLYSPSQNHETALKFASQMAAHGIQPQPIPVTAGNAGAALRRSIAGLSAVVLLIDPLVFDATAMHDILVVTSAAKVPTIGFLSDLTTIGVTIAIVVPAANAAEVAVRSAASASAGTRDFVESDVIEIFVSKQSAQEVGLDPKAIGATTVR
jgi:hypothetical protein